MPQHCELFCFEPDLTFGHERASLETLRRGLRDRAVTGGVVAVAYFGPSTVLALANTLDERMRGGADANSGRDKP